MPTSLATLCSKLKLCYFLNIQTRDTDGKVCVAVWRFVWQAVDGHVWERDKLL